MSLLTLKYIPQHSSQIIGQSLALVQLKEFIQNYKKQKYKAALLYGPVGTGKTSSVYALAKELNYDILEINSSDWRDEKSINLIVGGALGQQSLFFRPKIILIDEVDNISGVQDRGCLSALSKCLETSSFPVVFTANDPFDSKFKNLRNNSLMLEFTKIDHKVMQSYLQEICKKENIEAEEKALASLARQSDGDLRSALIDLQICASKKCINLAQVTGLSDRKRQESVLQALALIFKSSSANNALPALDNIDLDLNEIFLWMDENLPQEYSTPASLAKAYEHLSRADVFNGRIRRQQQWHFLVYINNLLTAGISSAKEARNPQFIKYRPTMRILRIWQAKMKLAKKKEIAEKLAKATHTSKKVALEQIGYLQPIFQKNQGLEIAKELDLSDEEMDWLMK